MNWYRKAQKIKNFLDRNEINDRIHKFKDMASELNYLSDYVFQNAKDAKLRIEEILKDKTTSSYPKVREILEMAFDKSLDNYEATSELCKQVMDIFYKEIKDMEKERKHFVRNVLPKKIKGRVKKGDK